MAITTTDGHRVIEHPHICPECDSTNVTTGTVITTDDLTESALFCLDCGEVWPLACVIEWGGDA